MFKRTSEYPLGGTSDGAAFASGAIRGTLAGLIGLGGAEFRLPLLLSRFHGLEAVISNKAVSLVAVATALVVLTCVAQAQDRSIIVASTTSIQDSGLYGRILLAFTKKSGIDVRVISQGTGQALAAGRRGDTDVVFVDARFLERKFVADGYGVRRHAVMYNEFYFGRPDG